MENWKVLSDLGKVLPMLEGLVKELKILNENLSDLKKMVADYLGWKVLDDEKKE